MLNKKVAILVTNGFEESELLEPKKALESENITVNIVSPEDKKVKSWTQGNWGKELLVDVHLDDADPEEYAGLILPGGVINPDKLRIDTKAIAFVKHFVKNKKPICAICHGPWTLINADAVKNYKMTSWPSLQRDLMNAGAIWVDEECVQDENLVTSRKPADLPAFNKKMLELLGSIDS
jgi:protease I